ncbi:MAG TPA: hypothetical protein VMV83_03935 [Rectinemataceae bacterium]|nr:hypothetical protein [Rectinemataceae bacterium]
MPRSVVSVVLACVAILTIHSQSNPVSTSPFSLNLGLSPNSLNTVGENLSVAFRPLRFLEFYADGISSKVSDSDFQFEKYAGPASGDVSRDILFGDIGLAFPLEFGPFGISPSLALTARNSDTYTAGRLLADPGSGFPDNTFSFFDEKSTELIIAANTGLALDLSLGPLGLSLGGFYFPYGRSRLVSSRFMCEPDVPVGQTTAAYYWDRRDSDSLFDCSGYGASAELSYSIAPLGIVIGLWGDYRIYSYSGDSVALRQVWWATQASSVTTVQQLVKDQSIASTVSISDGVLEAGASFRFPVLRKLLKLPGEPILGISYARTVKSYLYAYSATSTSSASAETWTETLEYVTYKLGWGM